MNSIENKIIDKSFDNDRFNIKIRANSNKILNKKKEKKRNVNDSLNYPLKNKNKFPYIGFIEYYFPILIPQKNYNLKLNNSKIVKYFSKEILQKLDLFYYLKLIITVELLKNSILRKKVKKQPLQFLLSSIYFLRDCDVEFIVEEINKNPNL